MTITRQAAVILIGGATASGKSAIARDLARTLSGEIVNADAMQVYDDLRILTARPSAAEEAALPHHLFGVADAADPWSAGRWLRAAREALTGIADRGRPAIVVGGTGLYLRALTQGLADIPPIPPDVRSWAAERFEIAGEAAFRAQLATVDPAAATRIARGDRQRLTRALEVHAATGKPLSVWQEETPPRGAETWRAFVTDIPREDLYRRCEARLETMIAAGALNEVARLVERGLDPALPAMKAFGFAPLADHLAGRLSLSEALARAATDTRRYAKRQTTWFRTQAADWPRIRSAMDIRPTAPGP
jgi:tRNA dimethylallyltransferase